MKQHSRFVFESFEYDADTGQIDLHYTLDDEVDCVETILLPKNDGREWDDATLERALFALHLAGGVSYFKTCCPKTIEVRSGGLNEKQAAFWNTVYTKGLGEFFYKNGIDFRNLVQFPHSLLSLPKDPFPLLQRKENQTNSVRYLVPIGGGKDSLVTIERLRAEGKDVTLFRMGKHPFIDALVKQTGLPCLTVERHLPKALFDLNAQGALNGHIPITTYLSFLCTVIAEIYGFTAVVLSSEKSADEGNVEYLGQMINHQWSKSAEAETLIRDYIHRNIDPGLQYENPLRDLSELQIAEEFCRYPQYFDLVTSCNKNWKIRHHGKTLVKDPLHAPRWCGSCPKCAFVFALLSAYLPKERLVKMFGKNLYDDASLQPLYRELLGLEAVKPFECVGTPDETRAAMLLAKAKPDYAGAPLLDLVS